jgi:hypothetical protein
MIGRDDHVVDSPVVGVIGEDTSTRDQLVGIDGTQTDDLVRELDRRPNVVERAILLEGVGVIGVSQVFDL